MLFVAACGPRAATSATTPTEDTGAPAPAQSAPSFASLNLDFEQGDGTTGWSIDATGYTAAADSTVRHGGNRSLRLASERAGARGATAELFAPVEDVHGRRVKLTGWIKTRDVTGGAGLLLRAEGSLEDTLFEDFRRRAKKGTNEWTPLEVTLVVPHEAQRITIGVMITGTGTVWFDDLALAVDEERPETIEKLTLL
jgi:hypothetical protein